MKLASLALLLATAPSLGFADEFDSYAPSWRGGQYSTQIAWTWPVAPATISNNPPTTFIAINGVPAATAPATPMCNFTSLDWDFNNGCPGLHSSGTASLWFGDFPGWDRGIGGEPFRFRMQVTYDGPSPFTLVLPGTDPATSIGSDAHHYAVEQDVYSPYNDWMHGWLIIGVTGGTTIREVRVDTMLLPAPGALSLMALSGVTARRRR